MNSQVQNGHNAVAGARVSLPDGTKSKDYEKIPKKGWRALAWEFLRRNPDYQKNFDAVADNLKSRKAKKLARRWGLSIMRDYRIRYRKKNHEPPKFRLGYVAMRRIESDDPDAFQNVSRQICGTEIIIQVDLRALLYHPPKKRQYLIEQIIAGIKTKLTEKVDVLKNTFGSTFDSPLQDTRAYDSKKEFPRYLQALDAKYRSKLTIEEIGEVLPRSSRTKNADGSVSHVEDAIRKGRDYMHGGYLLLAARARKAE
jgi:hypothetical protein